MKKRIFLLMLSILFTHIVNAQINTNPDPNGDPWYVSGIPEITPEIQAEIDAIPHLQLSQASINTSLPVALDNSQHMCMRDIFSQHGGSCGQESGVGYTYTYELNRIRNTPANTSAN